MSIAELLIVGILGPIDVAFLYAVWRYRNTLDRMISTSVNRWLVARHKPEDIGDLKPWCFTCRKAWPCAEWTKLHEERRDSQGVEW